MNYLRFSDFRVTISLNPFGWRFDFYSDRPKHFPNLRSWTLRILFLVFYLVIDDGKVVYDIDNFDDAMRGDPYEV